MFDFRAHESTPPSYKSMPNIADQGTLKHHSPVMLTSDSSWYTNFTPRITMGLGPSEASFCQLVKESADSHSGRFNRHLGRSASPTQLARLQVQGHTGWSMRKCSSFAPVDQKSQGSDVQESSRRSFWRVPPAIASLNRARAMILLSLGRESRQSDLDNVRCRRTATEAGWM